MTVTLREHLDMVDQNSTVSEQQVESLRKRLVKRFKKCGYTTSCKDKEVIKKYIDMIFETQDYRCTHWIEVSDGELNGVWNRPQPGFRDWKREDITYEIDHVLPTNAGGQDKLENYQFLSANANQFVKCSLTYGDLLKRVDLSDILKERIRTVLDRREKLFASEKWHAFISSLS